MDSLEERLLLIAAWHKRGGPTPKQPLPSRYKTCTEAAARIAEQDRLLKLARELIAAVDQMVEDTAPIFAEMEIARGCPYQGRQIGPELEALRQALAKSDRFI